jgi:uncharacterized membrane protein YhhN
MTKIQSLSFWTFAFLEFIVLLFARSNIYIDIATKCIPVFYLVLLVFSWSLQRSTLKRRLLLGAVAFSVVGDFFLAATFLKNYFLLGLGSFLIAQIFFISCFSFQSKLKIHLFIYPLALGIIVFGYLYPTLPKELILPVLIYMLSLTSMAWRASFR